MSAEEFLADVEGGIVDSHEHVLRIAFTYLDEGLWDGNGVFDVVEKLHAGRWSFGEGELRFNRTLDIFYVVQLAAAIYRFSAQLSGESDLPSPSDFPALYSSHREILDASAWRSYYSTAFLAQRTTARFYRLPDLQDLPDSASPLGLPHQRPPIGGGPHATKLPRWAYSVARTHRRQPCLPLTTLTQLALSTLKTTTARLHTAYPGVPPYSETQARFWLRDMNLGVPLASGSTTAGASREAWKPNSFGVLVAQGWLDMYAWRTQYSEQRWEASGTEAQVVAAPDVVDGAWKSEVRWCGLPDGGVGVMAWWRGWEPEVGSEEEVEFLAAVAVEETVGLGLEGFKIDELNCAMRSHVLLGVLRAAVAGGQERDVLLEELARGMVGKGRIGEDRAGRWLREALGLVEPYVRIWEGVWPDAEEERGKVLRRILVENGQLFARWKVLQLLNEFSFELGPRE